jgi:hypothetical protein
MRWYYEERKFSFSYSHGEEKARKRRSSKLIADELIAGDRKKRGLIVERIWGETAPCFTLMIPEVSSRTHRISSPSKPCDMSAEPYNKTDSAELQKKPYIACMYAGNEIILVICTIF